jgi:hypothetical protein
MKFSERIGKRSPKTTIQLESMDNDLRNGLWNVIDESINTPLMQFPAYYINETPYLSFFRTIWFTFYKEPFDQMPSSTFQVIDELRGRFFSWSYLDVYDFIDFIIQLDKVPFKKNNFILDLNLILERELSAYRVINGQLAPITTSNEVSEIENAINNANSDQYRGANIHLIAALDKLADRKNPDYRNSIKESISAVESICQVIAEDPKVELGKALKIIKTKIPIHGALEQGFMKIYGYTSDGDGIRHALSEESNLQQEDAVFMLVACSAFVNYLMVKAGKIQKAG